MRLTPKLADIMHNVVPTLLVGSGFNKEALYLIQGILRGCITVLLTSCLTGLESAV